MVLAMTVKMLFPAHISSSTLLIAARDEARYIEVKLQPWFTICLSVGLQRLEIPIGSRLWGCL
jgi:hypothetical protein